MFQKILIANRGEIALRIIKTLKKLSILSVAIYSEADEGTPHTIEADEAYCVGAQSPSESYLNVEKILEIARKSGAQAIHPGYGFLSENAEFAGLCEAQGITFIGPTMQNMISFGLKHEAKKLAEESKVPCLPGSPLLEDVHAALNAAEIVGYPVLLKSTAGGGGIGMHICESSDELSEMFHKVKNQGQAFFKCGDVFIEKYIPSGRHIEVQIFGDGKGNVAILGERDCSIQRRRQKIIEETPSPFVTSTLRETLFTAAKNLAEKVKYRSAGTIEFLVDVKTQAPYFLEVNTRLQVEHGVTEFVTGLDLVEWMIRLAAGEDLKLNEYVFRPFGHSIQVRVYAEVPSKNFQPSPGEITEVVFPQDIRIDTWIAQGLEVSAEYDPLLAKFITHGATREEALQKLVQALLQTKIGGIQTNLHYLLCICMSDAFKKGEFSTRFLEDFDYTSLMIEVVEAGMDTAIQDYPGRTTGWMIGIPPSGPMDDLAFRMANRLAGNLESAAGLEMTLRGPTLKFYCDTVIAITGAHILAEIDGVPVKLWSAVTIKKDTVLRFGEVSSSGCRSYLAVKGGFDVPLYLNSRSTFVLGKFGGHQGRRLVDGDLLPLSSACLDKSECLSTFTVSNIPVYPSNWRIAVMVGPHASPDFFTDSSMHTFFESNWKVHYNSNRLGIRLEGPKPEFTRKDGGDAGLHPSNIHDCVYAIGSINFTGDMPVILTCDGPSLGGFVCPCTIVKSELWKVGQVRPGDTIMFVPVDRSWALQHETVQDDWITNLESKITVPFNWNFRCDEGKSLEQVNGAVIHQIPESLHCTTVIYRQAGDKYILIEYGPLSLDFTLRFRVHALMKCLTEKDISGIIELSPGVRSLQVHFDSRLLNVTDLMNILIDVEYHLPDIEQMTVPTRILQLPIAFDDSATQDATSRYMQSVRPTAPYLPSNIEFIRRINGLASTNEVLQIILQAKYMVLGLGDVYLGAPCAVPLDPTHRLVTSKYNPARTYTPEGDVGIGGVYMCIYGMDSPGGYQLVGRTIPIWNKFTKNSDFTKGEPWLFQFFDQIQFYQVNEKELLQNRQDFSKGSFHLNVKKEIFSLKEYLQFLKINEIKISEFKKKQQTAFHQEVLLWNQEESKFNDTTALSSPMFKETDDIILQDKNIYKVTATISGNVWAVLVKVGDFVTKGTRLVTLEAMKMEFNVQATENGIVEAIYCLKGKTVKQGQLLLLIKKMA
jgi:urea carboxylase